MATATPPAAPVSTSKKTKSNEQDLFKSFSTLILNEAPSLPASTLSIDAKLAKFATIKGQGLTFEESTQLRALFEKKPHPIAYDGFEPSGRVTLAHGLLRVLNAKHLIEAGCRVRFWIGDVHALLNNKLGGDLKKIHSLSTYMVEVWKALGLDAETNPNFEVLLASNEIAKHSDAYWSRVLDIANQFTVERVQQCAPIMGRSVNAPVANTNVVMYPLMQVADGFLLDADIYQMGQDQEEGNVLVKEYLSQKAIDDKAPVFLHHQLLLGLKQGQFKMSTSDPESAIYVDDSGPEINTKIKKAFCVPGEIDNNPILDYFKYIVFPWLALTTTSSCSILIERSEKNGGNLSFENFDQLAQAFAQEQVHPADLKPSLAKYLTAFLEPVRTHFSQGELKKNHTNIKKLKIAVHPDGDKLVNLTIPAYPEHLNPREWQVSPLSLDEKFTIARSVGEECIQDSELRAYLENKPHPVCYDGFEPSGRMHIAQGVLRTVNVNKLTSAGAVFRFWVADWFAMLNKKMGGDLERIRTVGKYMVEIWKSTGMNMENVQFLWASDEIIANGASYWLRVMDIARRTTIARTVKCCTIMGRKEGAGMQAAQIMYPLMQCADIFFLRADICQLGLDQRKINMLARDYCDLVKIKYKPVVLSHHMLMGLKQGQEKMSKSDPDSAIFMEDAVEDVERKLEKAYCPEGIVDGNPILDYLKHLIFPRFPQGVQVNDKHTFTQYEELEKAFVNGQIQGKELKKCLGKYLNEILAPVRAHFAQGEAKELLLKVRSFQITR